MITLIRLLFGVSSHVRFETNILCKAFMTMITLIQSFFGVGVQVNL